MNSRGIWEEITVERELRSPAVENFKCSLNFYEWKRKEVTSRVRRKFVQWISTKTEFTLDKTFLVAYVWKSGHKKLNLLGRCMYLILSFHHVKTFKSNCQIGRGKNECFRMNWYATHIEVNEMWQGFNMGMPVLPVCKVYAKILKVRYWLNLNVHFHIDNVAALLLPLSDNFLYIYSINCALLSLI